MTGERWAGHNYYMWDNRTTEWYPGWTWEEPVAGKVGQDLMGGTRESLMHPSHQGPCHALLNLTAQEAYTAICGAKW